MTDVQLADFPAAANLVSLFLQRADALGERPMLSAKRDGVWVSTSWAEAARIVCVLAEQLRALGLADGDRVVLVSGNRPEWCLADLAIMAARLVTVPAYTTNTQRDHAHVLVNCGAAAVIVENAKLAAPLLPAMREAGVSRLIAIEPMAAEGVDVHDWASLATGDAAAAARTAVDARLAGIGRGDLACIIYTSGTGGAPKGVRQHHGAILHNVAGAARIILEDFVWEREFAAETFLSFLPLSHAYEHTAGQFLPIGLGAQIHYADGLERLAGTIAEVRPAIMVVVPRLFEVLRARLEKEIGKQGRIAAWLLARAVANAERRALGRLTLADRLTELAIDRLLRPKVRARFGGRMKALVSGGAPLNPQVGRFFEAVGLTLLQGYGQTEAAPIVSVNRPAAGIAMASVGPPLADTQVRFAADGEILVRGENVTHGYWQDEAATTAALDADGWLRTGDIGHVDAAGRVVITDRKKDMIVNDKGDNVAPQKVEGMLQLRPEIAQAMVAGDRRPHLVALLVADAEWAREWARAAGERFDLAALQQLPAFRTAVSAAVDAVNRQLSVTEKVRRFAFADEPFAIDNAELTPSLKIRRHAIRARYGERLDGLYRDGGG